MRDTTRRARRPRWAVLLGLGLTVGCGGAPLDEVDPAVYTASPTWTVDIRPLHARACNACHSQDGLRAGGVETDTYEAAWSARVKNACVTVSPTIVARFAQALRPLGTDGALAATPCEGWEVGSMPTGALPPLTPAEQVLIARWVELGGPL